LGHFSSTVLRTSAKTGSTLADTNVYLPDRLSKAVRPMAPYGRGGYTHGVRIPCLLALAAIGVAGIQAQSARESVVVILDSDGPVANAEASARLRALALARVERYGRPVYFDLTADAITPVPDSAAESFRSATFTFRPPIYAGVSLSFGEASEILRKNEVARDTVIVRECAARPGSDCGGAVHSAATTLVRDTESASARKLRSVVATATLRRAAAVALGQLIGVKKHGDRIQLWASSGTDEVNLSREPVPRAA
jgi:hypothetical protein